MKTLDNVESELVYTQVLDDVVNNREEVIITRDGREPVVIVPLADYESLLETVYLLRSPANAHRLLYSIENLESGRGSQPARLEN